jgi:predicted RNase H-like HicB family nuclease
MKITRVRDHYYWSEEDQPYIAEVPELAHYAADGNTYREALAMWRSRSTED